MIGETAQNIGPQLSPVEAWCGRRGPCAGVQAVRRRNSERPWYDRPEVASLGQFAVLPSHQSVGIGRRLSDAEELRAAESGAEEIALDTAEEASHLVSWYERCGYRFVEHAQWPGKAYRSVIVSKAIGCRLDLE
jgi:ribosomal protein S18 acetylase RimI-like enzyme